MNAHVSLVKMKSETRSISRNVVGSIDIDNDRSGSASDCSLLQPYYCNNSNRHIGEATLPCTDSLCASITLPAPKLTAREQS